MWRFSEVGVASISIKTSKVEFIAKFWTRSLFGLTKTPYLVSFPFNRTDMFTDFFLYFPILQRQLRGSFDLLRGVEFIFHCATRGG